MTQRTSKQRVVRTGPSLASLIGGQRVVDVASRARIGAATLYRALKGQMPHVPQLLAIATVLGVSEADLRAAILRSAKGAA